jgi:hypothetical protein
MLWQFSLLMPMMLVLSAAAHAAKKPDDVLSVVPRSTVVACDDASSATHCGTLVCPPTVEALSGVGTVDMVEVSFLFYGWENALADAGTWNATFAYQFVDLAVSDCLCH